MAAKDVRKNQTAKDAPGPADNPRAVAGSNSAPLFDIEQLEADLRARYSNDEKDLALVLDDARKLPKVITTKDDADEATELVKECRAIARDMETARKSENRIFATGKAKVDTLLGEKIDRAAKCIEILLSRLNAFNKSELEKARQAQEEEAKRLAEEAQARERQAEQAKTNEEREAILDDAERLATAAEEEARKPPQKAADLTRTRTDGGAMRTTRTETKVVIDDYAKLNLEALRPYIKAAVLETAVNQWAKATGYKSTMDGVRIFSDEIVSVI